ncbi:hypothetical protein ACOZ38_36430 [Sphaerisporangium viridialbum]|uniref:hypothetical protein n=1 Tax=Sphaerisporangium viridialbum TaxID=46189 RepID=UPI003C71771B
MDPYRRDGFKTYAKRYGVDRYTAHEDLTALGVALPASARRWAHRPVSVPRRRAERGAGDADDGWITLDGRLFFVEGHTSNGTPYGMSADEMSPYGDVCVDS